MLQELKSQHKKEMTTQLQQRDKMAQTAIAELEKKLLQYKQKQHKLQSALKYVCVFCLACYLCFACF